MSHNIFFIDNETNVVASVESALSKNGWRFQTAGSYGEAMPILRNSCFDLYLVDLVLDEDSFGGAELVRALRGDATLNHPKSSPIVFMSQFLLESEALGASRGRKWVVVGDEYRVPRLQNWDELTGILLEILSHHQANVGATPGSGQGGGSPQKSVPPSGSGVRPSAMLPVAPSPSADPRTLLLALRDDFQILHTRVQVAKERARKLVMPMTAAPAHSLEARMALNDAVKGTEMAAELLKRAADSLAKLGSSIPPS
jgi:hypothetical protein